MSRKQLQLQITAQGWPSRDTATVVSTPTVRYAENNSLLSNSVIYGLMKWLTELFTPSLLPLPCIESTV